MGDLIRRIFICRFKGHDWYLFGPERVCIRCGKEKR